MSKLAIEPFVLRGREVELHPLRVEHVPALAAASSQSRESYRYNPVPDGVDEAEAYVLRALRAQDEGLRIPFVIRWRAQVVGTTSYSDYQPWQWPDGSVLQRVSVPDSVEVGYTWLAASAQRTRCNSEAKFLLLRHAFEHWQVHRVAIRTDVRNQRSRQAIERLGAKLEGVLRAHMPGRDGTVRDSALYSIVREEWPELSARLQQRLAGHEDRARTED